MITGETGEVEGRAAPPPRIVTPPGTPAPLPAFAPLPVADPLPGVAPFPVATPPGPDEDRFDATSVPAPDFVPAAALLEAESAVLSGVPFADVMAVLVMAVPPVPVPASSPRRPATFPGGTTSLSVAGTGRSFNERMLTGSPVVCGGASAATLGGRGSICGGGVGGSTRVDFKFETTGSACTSSRTGGGGGGAC